MRRDTMQKGRPVVVGKDKAAIRVLLPRRDYEALQKIARLERSDVGTLVRRAIVHQFFLPDDGQLVVKRPRRWPGLFAMGRGQDGGSER